MDIKVIEFVSSESCVLFHDAEEGSLDADVKSKEDPEVTKAIGRLEYEDDINNLQSEQGGNDGIRSRDEDIDFDPLRSLRNFKIVVDGSVIDRKLFPDRVHTAYYKLCCARKTFLHRHLPKRINPTLAAGVIMETVNIAEGIRASPGSCSSQEDLEVWKKTLESLELLGMDVVFLRKRVDDLLGILTAHSPTRDLQVAVEECEGYEEVKLKRDRAVEKKRALELRMSRLKDALEEMDVEMKEMVESSARKKKEQVMRQLAAEPW
jgi:hypothetical protein